MAALCVIFYHYGKLPPYSPRFDFLINLSNTFVSYFFILSGFVMVMAYYKPEKKPLDPKVFYWNRFIRIYPIYLVALLGMIGYLWISYKQFVLTDTVLSLFLVQAWWPETPLVINGAGWSLSVELFFYLLFPWLLNRIYYVVNTRNAIIGCLGFWMIFQIGYILYFSMGYHKEEHNLFFFFSPIFHLNEFVLGNGIGLIYLQYFKGKTWSLDLMVLGMVVLIVYFFLHPIEACYHNGFMGFIFAPSILVLSINHGWISKAFKLPFLMLLGEASYGLYILQAPVFRAVEIA
ncbi:MAG: acyltransferase, partial [Cytophagales bacterium]|nr:acyltransferase [Cytophagales bacterium]